MYTENYMAGNVYRRAYYDSLQEFIQKQLKEAEEERKALSKDILSKPGVYRQQLKEMLGWPLTLEKDNSAPEAKRTFVAKDGELAIYRMQIDVLGVPFYGILFVKEDGKKRPLVISQHGALGVPELISDFWEGGSDNYNHMTRRILEHDVNVFAPQLFLWRKPCHILSEDEETDFEDTYENKRRILDHAFKQLGGSMVSFEIYCLTRALDYFQMQDYVDAGKMGMIGMSYGGFYTLYTAAVDPRLKTNLSCAIYNNRTKFVNYDWAIKNAAHQFTDNEVAMLIYPRGLHIAVGSEDPLFKAKDAVEEYRKLNALLPKGHEVTFEVFEGEHEFVTNDTALNLFMKELLE